MLFLLGLKRGFRVLETLLSKSEHWVWMLEKDCCKVRCFCCLDDEETFESIFFFLGEMLCDCDKRKQRVVLREGFA